MAFTDKQSSLRTHKAFQTAYVLHNLQVVKTCSLVFFILAVFIRVASVFYKADLQGFANYHEYNDINWMYLVVLPGFYFLSRFLIPKYNLKISFFQKSIRYFTISFGIFFTVCGMLTSFIARHNPHNNLTFFVVALITISVIMVFETIESLIIIGVLQVTFYTLLRLNHANNVDFIYNIIACIALLTGFFFLCRYMYLYKNRNFVQLEKIEEINAELKKAADFKNEVLGMVAHDLRNPIGAIEGIASLMQLDNTDDETEENLAMIKTACVKARDIVNDLIEAARDETDADLITQVCQVNQLITGIVKSWKNQNLIREIRVIEDGKTVYAKINTEKFHRVLDNLISNAIKFSKADGQIDVCLKDDKKHIDIEIKDYGIGIPANLLPHIFDRFSKSSRQGLRGEKSVGLGLNISKQIIEKHNGTLKAESAENQGSVFCITLPKVDAPFIT